MNRKLASIQRIAELIPINGADFVVAARVLGWICVVRKDWFKSGDLGCYFEIDSRLPQNPVWDDIVGKYNYRIKTQRFRGVISQGFMIPLSMLDIPKTVDRKVSFLQPDGEYITTVYPNSEWEVGDDLTELLGIKKWEPKESGDSITNVHRVRTFPGFIPKTDEIRVQSAPDVIKELIGLPYYITEKCDGTSFTAYRDEEHLHVCSRNNEVKEEDNIYWKAAHKYNLMGLPTAMAVQGELCGPSIQRNRLGLNDHDLFIFNVFNIKEGRYLGYDEFSDFCYRYSLQKVPVIETLNEFNYSLEELIEKAKGTYRSGNPREGIVIRPTTEKYSATLKGRLSFKVINNDYLLHGGEE